MTHPVRSPAPQESLDGFLRRLAEQEFWPDVSDFLAGLGLRYGRRMIEDGGGAGAGAGDTGPYLPGGGSLGPLEELAV